MTNIIYSIKKYEIQETDYPDVSIDKINTIRKSVGLYELKEKFRKCINCRDIFKSIQYRMCKKCRKVANNMGINDEINNSEPKLELEEKIFELQIQVDQLKTDNKKLLKFIENISRKLNFAVSESDKMLLCHRK